MTNLETQLSEALQTAARNEILRNPSSATQFNKQPEHIQTAAINAYSAWALKAILPIINHHLKETRT